MTNIEIFRIRSAFENEALPHMKAAYDFAFRICGDREHASDLVQDGYLKALRSFESFTPGSNCKAWLFQIIKNSYINERRRARFHGTLSSPASDEGRGSADPFDQLPAPPAIADQTDAMLGDEVSEALQRIPEIYRTILILSDIENYQYEEIAQFINRPVGTVRSRLHRARKLLASSIKEFARREGYLAA